MNFELFIKDYGPLIKPEASVDYFENLYQAICAATKIDGVSSPTNHLWTIVEAEDSLYILPGNRLVDRVHMWVVTTKPHNSTENTYTWHQGAESEASK